MPNLLPPVPNNEPDDTDIRAEDPGEILPPDDPGDAVELSVDVPAGLDKSAVYTRKTKQILSYHANLVTIVKTSLFPSRSGGISPR